MEATKVKNPVAMKPTAKANASNLSISHLLNAANP